MWIPSWKMPTNTPTNFSSSPKNNNKQQQRKRRKKKKLCCYCWNLLYLFKENIPQTKNKNKQRNTPEVLIREAHNNLRMPGRIGVNKQFTRRRMRDDDMNDEERGPKMICPGCKRTFIGRENIVGHYRESETCKKIINQHIHKTKNSNNQTQNNNNDDNDNESWNRLDKMRQRQSQTNRKRIASGIETNPNQKRKTEGSAGIPKHIMTATPTPIMPYAQRRQDKDVDDDKDDSICYNTVADDDNDMKKGGPYKKYKTQYNNNDDEEEI